MDSTEDIDKEVSEVDDDNSDDNSENNNNNNNNNIGDQDTGDNRQGTERGREAVLESKESENFDDDEGEVKEYTISRILDETPVDSDYVEKGLTLVNKDTETTVQVVDGHVVNGSFYNTGDDNSETVIKSHKTYKGIEDIVAKIYKGHEGIERQLDVNEGVLLEKITNVRRWYRLIDGEIKSLNKLGFVKYHGFINECPNMMNILKSFID